MPLAMEEKLIGHETAVRHLRNAVRSGRMSHALAFVGPSGVGKETCAVELAAGMLCEARGESEIAPFGCGHCRSCQKVTSGVHPDLHLIMSEAEAFARGRPVADSKRKPARTILVDQIRELSRIIRMKPHEGRAKVAIIVNSHQMNTNAANALLKTLEEPPAETLLILLAPHARSLLPTVVSRCQRLVFGPLTQAEVERVLQRCNANHISERVNVSDGSVETALEWEPESGDTDADKGNALLYALLSGTTGERMDAAERVGKDRGDADHLLKLVERGLSVRMRNLASTWSERATSESRRLLELIDATELARQRIRDNAHVQLTIEQLLLDSMPPEPTPNPPLHSK